MSRIGKLPITIPTNVDVNWTGSEISVKGKFGTLETKIPDTIAIDIQKDQRSGIEALFSKYEGKHIQTAPVVMGRLSVINGESFNDSSTPKRASYPENAHCRRYNWDSPRVGRTPLPAGVALQAACERRDQGSGPRGPGQGR